mmetsp:Transcript_75/g.170  ORF Transcript_75/g.170 Transcript_75/m.170 type:complete len:240 (-) Transcript_75:150-869(-)|eukprot:CAMPEP_0116088120 /NCGR_PEP_ID=MMETSP0327-20121206/5708_1 /TAXON_ID=44447 /ORGANISM="Pseudo-nitzschia delicatissima, Strain B596" /LENGTH=239 /DNA_ID=CAMNT_0003579195 /DNA_START=109 /DNA_END=828 /DNA_ORIENTATION=+
MSLSFVSSAVQVGTADGGFEETAIENKETEAVNRRNAHKPLFEQLRSNQEEDQEKKEEAERQIMRSTCALDDEDVAHLDALQKQQSERERKIQERTKNELDSFRAARALRQQAALGSDQEEEDNNDSNNISRGMGVQTLVPKEKVVPTPSLPVIKVKKRKRRTNDSNETTTSKPKTSDQESNLEQKEKSEKDLKETGQSVSDSNTTGGPSTKKSVTNEDGGGGLGSLLSGYGSSSSDEE